MGWMWAHQYGVSKAILWECQSLPWTLFPLSWHTPLKSPLKRVCTLLCRFNHLLLYALGAFPTAQMWHWQSTVPVRITRPSLLFPGICLSPNFPLLGSLWGSGTPAHQGCLVTHGWEWGWSLGNSSSHLAHPTFPLWTLTALPTQRCWQWAKPLQCGSSGVSKAT